MRIAVIGGGVSGLTAAYILSRRHEVTLFEAGDYIGGHTHTHRIEDPDGQPLHIDSGFIVFNDRAYPNFRRLLDRLEVECQPSDMSFSMRCEESGLEYQGSSLNGLFAQRRNLLRPDFLRMVADIVRFYRQGKRMLSGNGNGGLHANGNGSVQRKGASAADMTTVGEFLRNHRYSSSFVRHHLLPVSAAIWSADPRRVRDMPIEFMLRFFHNHGMLDLSGRPQWRVIKGGSQRYVEKMIRPFSRGIRLNSPVVGVRRLARGVEVKTPDQEWEYFDQVVIGAHSDQALAMLRDADRAEREILGSIAYQPNQAVLHTDRALLPRRRRAWASWNYHLMPRQEQSVALTYHMNRLQTLAAKRQYCVTLNRGDIDSARILRRLVYQHPVYTPQALRAQSRHADISGRRRTHYCGAYWGYGFHEDGVNSALRVCRAFGMEL
ncbi:MAG TPA: FAD-dependent oxidoreductase [Acidobacteriota bacterium]|nr:FAD-dependent oxidoreductase [Acidobacteriota bacterium]